MRSGHLSCLTRDHTFVQDMILEGELTPQKALNHLLRHMLTQAVGAGEPLEVVQTRSDPIVDGDRFLFCTDSLYNSVNEERIAVQLNRRCSTKQIAQGLLHGAIINRARKI